jgi:hypothetical protein
MLSLMEATAFFDGNDDRDQDGVSRELLHHESSGRRGAPLRRPEGFDDQLPGAREFDPAW